MTRPRSGEGDAEARVVRESPQAACFSPDGKLLATGATEPGPERKTITLWAWPPLNA